MDNREDDDDDSGMTVADFLDNLVTDPKRWLGLIGLLTCLAVIAMGAALVFERLFKVSATEVRLGPESSRVVFESVDRQGHNREFLVLVHPQGWQKTDIEIQPGDHLQFRSDGSINIDLAGIIDKVQLRGKLEEDVAKRMNLIRSPVDKRVPEDFFTPQERASLQLARAWIDPDGFKNPSYATWSGRHDWRVLPDENAGGLVAAVKSSSTAYPARSESFFVGRSRNFVSPAKGSLWFTVNDDLNADPENPSLFFDDNIGLFWVKVRLSSD